MTPLFWIGVVENRLDPLKAGRVQVRIVGQHTADKTLIPTKTLPWASCLLPVTGTATQTIKEGEYVFGTYLDGGESQLPLVLGVLHGIPEFLRSPQEGFSDPRTESELKSSPKPPTSLSVDGTGAVSITDPPSAVRYPSLLNEPELSRVARNQNATVMEGKKSAATKSIPSTKLKTYDEPSSPYAPSYPYDHVMETESGHIIEFDDTPGAERIHIYHRSGSADEYFPDGTKVSRVHADAFEIVLADKHIYIQGDCHITAKKDLNIKAGKDINIEAGGMVNIKADMMIQSQAGLGITSWTTGPHSLQGLPINLNGVTPPPLGPPTGPIVIPSTSTTVVVNPPVVPSVSDPGTQVLMERPGANIGDKKPDVLSTPTKSPQGIPPPTVKNTDPVPTISTPEGSDVMIRALNRAKISDPTQRAMIYAQASHESQGFKRLFESFKFTDKGLLTTWGRYFKKEEVPQFLRQDEKIANRVYGGRMGNADEASGEGFKYRGRGFIQLTGKENYLEASKSFKQDFVAYPDAAAVPDMAADIAVWYFKKGKKTGYRGKYDDIISVTKFVNGGTNGLEDRTKKFELAKSNTSVTTLTSAV